MSIFNELQSWLQEAVDLAGQAFADVGSVIAP